MNRVLPLIVAMLVVVDIYTLSVMQAWRSRPQPPDLTPRVAQLEKDLSQAQSDLGEMKQELLLVERRGQPQD